MAIIALNGYSGSGKDLVGRMIKLNSCKSLTENALILEVLNDYENHEWWVDDVSKWEIKKFAGKLKEIASMLTGIPVQMFEDQEFKKTTMSPEWDHIIETMTCSCDVVMGWYSQDGKCKNCGEPTKITRHPKTVREFLQKLGTDGLRDGLHTNVWVNALFADYTPELSVVHKLAGENGVEDDYEPQPGDITEEYPNWIITDCRFPNEAQAVKDHGGLVIRVERPGVTAVNAHPSETALDNWAFDAVIQNDGSIEDLLQAVKFTIDKQNVCYP